MYQYVHFHTAKPINLDAKANMDVDTDPDSVVGVKTKAFPVLLYIGAKNVINFDSYMLKYWDT